MKNLSCALWKFPEVIMHEQVLGSTRDALLFALPFLGLLLVGLFRLDEMLITPKRRNSSRRPPSGVDINGEQILCDPDGRRVPAAYRQVTTMVRSSTK
jgi:hypothetical protein